jgi:hypothetical protein
VSTSPKKRAWPARFHRARTKASNLWVRAGHNTSGPGADPSLYQTDGFDLPSEFVEVSMAGSKDGLKDRLTR